MSHVGAEIKFCGMTRREDAEFATTLGEGHYVGVIFAGGPRAITVERAMDVLAPVPEERRVGVFGDQSPAEIVFVAERLRLAVVQLHLNPTPERIAEIRAGYSGDVWPVCRVAGVPLPPAVARLGALGDGLVLDSFVQGTPGGTGVPIQWTVLGPEVERIRGGLRRFILAGGLRPENVGMAITTLSPSVVDVSSGVESAPGIKDHGRMRAFRDAVAALHQP